MKATAETTAEIKSHVAQTVHLLKQLVDEIRVELHLAGMEAQTQWEAFAPKLAKAEQAGHQLSESARHVLNDTVDELKAFKAALIKQARARKEKS